MTDFDDRLRLQKFIYLLQAHDVYLGYDFSWHLRGPYCTTLAAAGFALEGFYNNIPMQTKGSQFANSIIQSRFDKFAKFIKGNENDVKFLEAAASLHFLIKTRQAIDDNTAIRMVAHKMPNADEMYIRNVLNQIRREGLL